MKTSTLARSLCLPLMIAAFGCDPGSSGKPGGASTSATSIAASVVNSSSPEVIPSASPSASPSAAPSASPSAAPSDSGDAVNVPPTHSSASPSAPPALTPNVALPNETEGPGVIAFRPNGRAFAAGLGKKVSLVPIAGGDPIALADQAKPVRAIVFSIKGDRLATVDEGGAVRVWDASSGRLVADLPAAPSGEVNALAFSDDGKRLAAASSSATIWDVASKKVVCTTADAWMFQLAFTRDMGSLVTTGNGMMARWDAGTCKQKVSYDAPTGGTFGSWVAPDGKHVAAAAPDGHGLSLYDAVGFKGLGILAKSLGCDDHVGPVAFSRDGEVLLASGSNRWFRSIRLDSMKTIATYDVPAAEPVDEMVMFGDGQRLFLVRGDKGQLVSATSKKVAYTFELKGARTFDVSWDMKSILGAGGGSAYVWDAATGALLKTFAMPR